MSAKIRILFIGSFLSAHRGSKGPTEQISDQLKRSGYIVWMASRLNNRYLRLIDTIFKLLLFRGKIVCVDVYSGPAFRMAEISLSIAKLKNHKVILNLHGGKLPQFFENNRTRVLSLFSKATKIISPSNYIIETFAAHKTEIMYMPNPLDLNSFPFNRNSIKPFSLLWVRAFDRIYNPHVPVEVLSLLKRTWPNASLTMVGPDTGELAAVKQLIEEKKLTDSVQLTGPVPNSKLSDYYQTHEVFINTTSYESFGVSLMEAAACGIPIVSNSVGEIPLMWSDKKNILLVNNNSTSDFESAISLLFKSKDTANQISISANQIPGKFSLGKIIENWDKLLHNI